MPPERRPRRRVRRRRRLPRFLIALVIVLALGTIAAMLVDGEKKATAPPVTTKTVRAHARRTRRQPVQRDLVERVTGSLPAPLMDPSYVAKRRRRAPARRAQRRRHLGRHGDPAGYHGSHGRSRASVGSPRHRRRDNRNLRYIYVFGGGNGPSQLSEIVRVDPSKGTSSRSSGACRLRARTPTAAAIGGTAYIVGGYTGTRWLDTIVAWRPGAPARVVAHLPYAAALRGGDRRRRPARDRGRLARRTGRASDAVLEYAPATGRVTRLGPLPAPTTHAAAAALGGVALRDRRPRRGDSARRPTAIVAIDVAHDARPRRRAAAERRAPTSPLSPSASRILVAGGRGAAAPSARSRDARSRRDGRRARHAAARRTLSASERLRARRREQAAPAPRAARSRCVYVPNSQSNTVDVIDPHTYRVVDHFAVGGAAAARRAGLGPEDALRHERHRQQPHADRPADGQARARRSRSTTRTTCTSRPTAATRSSSPSACTGSTSATRTPSGSHHSLDVPCAGVDHMDFSADGRYLIASCEFSGQLVKVDVATRARRRRRSTCPTARRDAAGREALARRQGLLRRRHARRAGSGRSTARRFKVIGFLPTGAGVHGLYPSRDAKYLYVTNRGEGSISRDQLPHRQGRRQVADPRRRQPRHGRRLGRRQGALALRPLQRRRLRDLDARTAGCSRRIPVGGGPHGLCVWPQPGRYSLGHTGILR